MVADVITLAFQLSLISVAGAVVVGLVRDELADRADAVGRAPASLPGMDVLSAAAEKKTGTVNGSPRTPRARAGSRLAGTSRRKLASTTR